MAEPAAPDGLYPLKQPRTLGIVLLALAISGFLLALTQYVSSSGQVDLPYYIFWTAYFLAMLPLGYLAIRKSTGAVARTILVVTIACWSTLPKWLRTGIRPLYADEFQHYRLLENISNLGRPVVSHVILSVGGAFPGMEYFTFGLKVVSGVTLFGAAFCVTVGSHVAEMVGVYALISTVTKSHRAGAIGAIIFFLNPSYMWFDSQYAYETLSLAMVIWGFLFAYLAVNGSGAGEGKRLSTARRWQCAALSMFLSLALTLTHHVSSGYSAAILVLYAISVTVMKRFGPEGRQESQIAAWSVALFAIAVTAFRYVQLRHVLANYLAPVLNVGEQFSQILHVFGIGAGTASRTPFGASSAPIFELVSAYLMVPILLFLFVGAILVLIRKWRDADPFIITSTVLGLAFFVSVPLTTSRTLAETAHRSWAYSFVGLAVLIAAASEPFLKDGLHLRRWRLTFGGSHRATITSVVTLIVCFAIVSFGTVSSGTSTDYRFATPTVQGSDPNEINTETSMVVQYFLNHNYAHQGLIVDRMVSHQLDVLPESYMVLNTYVFPMTYNLNVSWHDLVPIDKANAKYIEVNSAMSRVLPTLGFWYQRTERFAYTSNFVAKAAIFRYHCFNWLNAVFITKNLTIYQINQAVLQSDITLHSSGLSAACMAGAPPFPKR